MSDINNDKKFGKLVESIGKATSRYRKTKKEADGNVSVAKKTVKSAVNSRKKAKLTEEEIKIEKLPAVSKRPKENSREIKPRKTNKEVKKPMNGLKIIPLGGLEHIGMNITAFEYEDSIIVVDCGMSFPEDDMLGIDCVIPNVSYLKKNIDKVKGFVITHGHEDHIGALPYILKDINVPVYATRLTVAILESKLSEKNMLKTTKRKIVKYG